MNANSPRPCLLACLGLLCAGLAADAGEVLFRDDFSGPTLNPAWVTTYQVGGAAAKSMRGFLVVKHSTSWYLPSPRIPISAHRHGVRLAADVFYYPRPGFDWHQTGAPYPLGFQDERGGVGKNYARFAFIDANRDGYTDAVRFETKGGESVLTTNLARYNPATDADFHRFAIDWTPGKVMAYFDGKVFATHAISIKAPLWVVGRNEYVNVVMDNFELTRLGPNAPPPRSAASSQRHNKPIQRNRAGEPRYWYLQGLHYEGYRIGPIFVAGVLTVSEGWSDGMQPSFPPVAYEDLAAHDAAIVANVDIKTMGPSASASFATTFATAAACSCSAARAPMHAAAGGDRYWKNSSRSA